MNPALDKIRKLLRLGKDRSATPAEAAAALRKAMDLAMAHGIDIAKVSTEERDTSTTHRTTAAVFGVAEKQASSLVKKHFGVDTLFDTRNGRKVIHFIGYPETCDLAIYCFTYLVRAARAAWKNRRNKRLKTRDAYMVGFFIAMDDLMPPTFHRPGLVPSFQTYRDEILLQGRRLITRPAIPSSKPLPFKALASGYMAGRRTTIRNAIRTTDKPLIS